MWHGYFGIENLALNGTQRGQLVAALRLLGPASDPSPARLCHWRTRLDNQAVIFEALFEEDAITVQAFKNRLGVIFGVSPSTITHSTQQLILVTRQSAAVTLTRSGVDYLRVIFFGYDGTNWPTREESRQETLSYLATHRNEWESEEA